MAAEARMTCLVRASMGQRRKWCCSSRPQVMRVLSLRCGHEQFSYESSKNSLSESGAITVR
eukprot:scaffold89693_cov18-Prasinocladus_malaysianus.AAC.1